MTYTEIVKPLNIPFPVNVPFPLNVSNVDFVKAKFKWDAAFRFGLGYNLPYDGWDVYASWMHHMTTPKSSIGSDTPNLGLLITLDESRELSSEGSPQAKGASEKWELKFNSLAAELGRHYCVGACSSVRPFVSVKGAIIDQKLFVNYTDLFMVSRSSIGAFVGSQEYQGTGDFMGIGPRIGLNANWSLWKWLDILANLSGTLFAGSFDSHAKTINFDPTAPVFPLTERINQSKRVQLTPHL